MTVKLSFFQNGSFPPLCNKACIVVVIVVQHNLYPE